MNRTTIGRIGTIGLLLGTATIACTPGTHVAALSDGAAAPHASARAEREAGRARTAIAAHKGEAAVAAAEKAVALAPNNADHRLLLGQAYLAAGRFASAEVALRDTLTLSPDQPRARLNLALAEIAQNKAEAAQATLAPLAGRVPDSDLGLALALAGDDKGAIQRLGDLVRSGKSDARARQNLALALALGQHWPEARAVAMQDTPPDRIGDQIAGWAELAVPGRGAMRVATMLGTTPALTDPGQPERLALAAPTAAAPVQLALAAPATPETPAVQPAQVATIALDDTNTPAPAPAPAPATVAADVAMPGAAPVASPPPLIRAPAQPVRVAAAASRSVAPGPELVAVRQGGFVVQLGAYSRRASLDAAWSRAARLTPKVVRFTPVRGSTSTAGATLVRLSVGGFRTRADADALCGQLRAGGHACFVRGVGNDAPLEWVRKDDGRVLQLASL